MDLFSSMQREDAQELCADIIDLVLATDMTDHFSIVLSFKTEMKTALENECKTAGDKEWGPSVYDCKIIQNVCNLKRETRMAKKEIGDSEDGNQDCRSGALLPALV